MYVNFRQRWLLHYIHELLFAFTDLNFQVVPSHIFANVKSVGQPVLSVSFASGPKANVCISTRSSHTQSKIKKDKQLKQAFMMSAYDVNLFFLTSVFGV